jgi:hypothetical protein
MVARLVFTLVSACAAAGCALGPGSPPPAPVIARLECAEDVVDRYGFLDREANWHRPGPQVQDPPGFIAQRGDSDSREYIYVSVLSHPTTGAVRLYVRGTGHWANAGRPHQLATSEVDYVARQVRDRCGGSVKPHSQL